MTTATTQTQPQPSAPQARITGPYTFENLDLYLLHRPDALPAGTYDVLQRAMDRKAAVVHETGNVGQLLIENMGDVDLFIQAGDIVKGGRQDRVLGADLIVGGKSGRVPIPSFCVESGRWSQRQGESSRQFGSADACIASKALKRSAKVAGHQGAVWEAVAAEQIKLEKAVCAPVCAPVSSTSYQLTLENKHVQKRTKAGLNALLPLIHAHADTVGFAFAVNGQLNSADAYVTHDLFALLWEKLLRAAITEAIAEGPAVAPTAVPAAATAETSVSESPEAQPKQEKKPKKIRISDVDKFLGTTAMKPTPARDISERVRVKIYEDTGKSRFETEDIRRNSACVHLNVLSA